MKLQKNPHIYSCNVNPIPNPTASHNLILFQFTPLAPHALSLMPQPHISNSQSHSLTLSQLSHSLSHTTTSPQAVKHRQSPTPISHYRHTVTSLQLSTLSTLFHPHPHRSHTVALPFAPLIFLAHGLTASLHLNLYFFFWVQFVSM